MEIPNFATLPIIKTLATIATNGKSFSDNTRKIFFFFLGLSLILPRPGSNGRNARRRFRERARLFRYVSGFYLILVLTLEIPLRFPDVFRSLTILRPVLFTTTNSTKLENTKHMHTPSQTFMAVRLATSGRVRRKLFEVVK